MCVCILNLDFPVRGRSIRLGVCLVRFEAIAADAAGRVTGSALSEEGSPHLDHSNGRTARSALNPSILLLPTERTLCCQRFT